MVVTCGEAVALFATLSYGHDWNPVLTYVLHPPSPPTKPPKTPSRSVQLLQSNSGSVFVYHLTNIWKTDFCSYNKGKQYVMGKAISQEHR